jgi:hypothetical protein
VNQRNKLVASVAVAAATAAIGTGALISSNAMAASSDAGKATVTVVSAGSDGSTPISCTFHDVTLPNVDPSQVKTANVAVGAASATAIPVNGGSVNIDPSSATVTGAGTMILEGSAGASTAAPAGSAVIDPSNLVAISAGNPRPGTEQECAALKSTLPTGS